MAVLCALDIPRTSPFAPFVSAGRSSGTSPAVPNDDDDDDATHVVWIPAAMDRRVTASSAPGREMGALGRPLLRLQPGPAPATASAAIGAGMAHAWTDTSAPRPMDAARDVAVLSIAAESIDPRCPRGGEEVARPAEWRLITKIGAHLVGNIRFSTVDATSPSFTLPLYSFYICANTSPRLEPTSSEILRPRPPRRRSQSAEVQSRQGSAFISTCISSQSSSVTAGSQIDADPPHSLHVERRRPCSQIPPPPQSLHVERRRP